MTIIRGSSGNDGLFGSGGADHFDANAGGNDFLFGQGGDDVYWLGRGTGHDVVDEVSGNTGAGDTGDKIRVKSGISPSSVELLRSKNGADLYVRLLDANGVLTDSLRVVGYYTSLKAKVESVLFADGTVWDAMKLGAASYERYRGSARNDLLLGTSGLNHFDGDAGGNDTLLGRGGDDVYWLGRGTGHDVVNEVFRNAGTGDTGDEIRVKAGIAPFSVELLRSKNGSDLHVRLVGANGMVTDSLKVEGYYTSSKAKVERLVFADGTVWGAKELDAAAPSDRIRGTAQDDILLGDRGVNHFDADAGGSDKLRGRGGDDVYWLGRGTGHDIVDENYQNTVFGDTGDEIRVKAGIAPSSVELLRSKDGSDLYVRVLDANGVVADSLKVKGYYTSASAKVESVVFADGTVWDAKKLDAAPYRGGAQDDILLGGSGVDHFDGDAGGSDTLRGRSGDDVYWLGHGTGHDIIDEADGNTGNGDTGDKIRVKAGIAPSLVRVARDGDHLYVRVLDANGLMTDSLRVSGYYTSSKAKVESVVFDDDGTVWGSAKLDAAPPYDRYRGGAQDEILHGGSGVDHFDGDAGGSDTLRGRGGDDVYWLGYGTGHDVVDEADGNTVNGDTGDKIRVKDGISPSSVKLLRSKDGADLYVRVVGVNGVVADSLKVKGYYTSSKAKVESVVFADDGTVWDANKLGAAPYERYRGSGQADVLLGTSGVNHFDGDAGGSDTLRGRGGDDVYWLGYGTGHDVIDEADGNTVNGDTGDKIRVKDGISPSSVKLLRSKDGVDLYVRVVGVNGVVADSLKVKGYYTSSKAKVESVVFADDGTVWDANKLGAAPYDRYRGGGQADVLLGTSGVNHFDGDAGGSDTLRGRGGDDVYWLGYGTGHDVVDEADGNTVNGDTGDKIRVKDGISPSSVKLLRSKDGADLYVRVVGVNGVVADSLKVKGYYTSSKAKVESVVFADDGTVWDANKLGAAPYDRYRGGGQADVLLGTSGVNHFDGDAGGSDTLRGRGGDDVYWLGYGTGHDVVDEADGNTVNGDTGDKIRVKDGISPSSVKLLRSKDGADLYVRVVGVNGVVADSLKVKGYYTSSKAKVESVVFADDGTVWDANKLGAAPYDRYRGGGQADVLLGTSGVNHFDGDAGGSDTLRGRGGDDVYWLGYGTGHDVVDEADGNTVNGDTGDKIRVKDGISPSSVKLLRSKDGADLYVRVVGVNGVVADSLKVKGYYTSSKAKVESVVFADGTVWDAKKLDAAPYRGGAQVDILLGGSGVDHFDGDAGGSDTLRGRGGDDVYWLGHGTGHDIIDEADGNTGNGDTGDKIRVKDGIAPSSVKLLRSKDGADLHVRVVGVNGVVEDSLKVLGYYTSPKAKVESVVFDDGTVWDAKKLDAAPYRGGAQDDILLGGSGVDHFDGDAGGSDTLRGRSGDDVYWLGHGTGHDIIDEADGNTGVGDTGDKIRVKAGIAPSLVRVARDGDHLYVRVLDANGLMTDSLRVSGYYTSSKAKVESVVFDDDGTVWGSAKLDAAPPYERYRGGAQADILLGGSGVDHFDGNVGGSDTLRGRGGDDVYWLGRGTGHDVVDESHQNTVTGDTGDEIRVKAGIAPSSVRLERDRENLYVRVFDTDWVVTDSLTVKGYYTSLKAKVERVVFADDGTVWDAKKLDALRHRGTSGNDVLSGYSGRSDIFEADAGGSDTLRGQGGDDVYWLGRGTGHDIIDEAYENSGNGDTGDEIRVKAGIAPSSVRMERSHWGGNDLYVRVFGADGVVTDSLTVKGYYTSARARVERVVFADGTVWGALKMDAVRIRGDGDQWGDALSGLSDRSDIFDADVGGNDWLYGKSGDDVYWLGRRTGHDIIDEAYENSGNGDTGDEIRVKAGIAPSSVNLLRSKDGADLYVRVLGANGLVTDSLKVQGYYTSSKAKVERVVFADDGTVWDAKTLDVASYERYRGSARNDILLGDSGVNHFDGDVGGSDTLRGRSGDDVYWLGRGTGHDVVDEVSRNEGAGDTGDEIHLKSGIGVADVRLRRVGWDLHVEVLDAFGTATDSLRVKGYYASAKAKVERVVFADNVSWGASEIESMRRRVMSHSVRTSSEIRGTSGDDVLTGSSGRSDIFDAYVGGSDTLRGRGGDDVYWLGRGTGHDIIDEAYGNTGNGDTGDEIRVKAGIAPSSVRLQRSHDNLYVRLFGADGVATDSLMVKGYYGSARARVERVVFADKTVWGASKMMSVLRPGGTDSWYGYSGRSDTFDSDVGDNRWLFGKSGDDVYWLGRGTGHDTINEAAWNAGDGDTGDEIRVKAGIAPSSVRLERKWGNLYVRVLDADGVVTDSLEVRGYYWWAHSRVERVVFADKTVWGAKEMDAVRIRGTSGNDILYASSSRSDIFDADVGGRDTLRGQGGDDVYWLGRGTDHDIIDEAYENAGNGDTGDEIRVKAGIAPSSVRLERDRENLYVRLFGADGVATDSLTVKGYYTSARARVERVVFADKKKTSWGASEMDVLRRRGTSGNDELLGYSGRSDIFDADVGGSDTLRGQGGDDVYWLGRGTDHDIIDEAYGNTGNGDTGDKIRVKAGIGVADVRLRRVGDDLYVDALGSSGTATDSLKVKGHYASDKSRVESIHAAGKVLLASQYLSLMHEMALFDAGNSQFSDMNSLLGRFWQDESTLATPSGSG